MFLILAALATISANAQFNRTAVSVAGLDTNLCTVASPCRTFNRAITQTNTGGEVIVLTSAGYGTFVIDRAISVIAPPGIYAGVTVSATNQTAIAVTAPSDADVLISGLSLKDGTGVQSFGIRADSGNSLTVDRVTIDGFFTQGECIKTTVDTLIQDSTFLRCGQGVHVINAAIGAHVRGLVNRCVFRDSNSNATLAEANAFVVIRDSASYRSFTNGFSAGQGSLQTNVVNCIATGSVFNGFQATNFAVMRVARSVATDNGNGLDADTMAILESYGNNKARGNTVDVQFSLPIPGTFTPVSQQ